MMDVTMIVDDDNEVENDSSYGMELDDGIPIDSSDDVSAGDVILIPSTQPPSQIGTSSYGKRNFVLPLTFFDIPSNVTLLAECRPLTIPVVDRDKYPWFYKKSTVSRTESEKTDMNNLIDNDCVNIDLTDEIYDRFEKVDYSLNQSSSVEGNRIRRRKRSKRTIHEHKLVQDKIKDRALRQIDLTHVDFKRNVGLIGLKIQRRNNPIDIDNFCEHPTLVNNVLVTEDLNEQSQNKQLNTGSVLDLNKVRCNMSITKHVNEVVGYNSKPDVEMFSTPVKEKLNESTQNKSEEKIDTIANSKNKLHNYISVVDKGLCNLGTDLIPLNTDTLKGGIKKIHSESKITSTKVTKLSETIVKISKSKLSKRSIYKIDPKQNCKKNISKDSNPAVKVDVKQIKNKMSSKSSINESSHMQKSTKKNATKVLNTAKKKSHQERNKEKGQVKDMTRCESSVLSYHKPSATNNDKLYQTQLFIKPKENKERLQNSDLNNHQSGSSTNELIVTENCPNKVNISPPLNKLNNPGECEQNNKQVFTITAVSIDKLRNMNKPEVNERNETVSKSNFGHQHTAVVNDETNKNVLPAVRNEISSNTDIIVNNVKQTSTVNTIGSLPCSSQKPINHVQSNLMHNNFSSQVRPNYAINGYQVRPQIRHNLPIHINMYDRPKFGRAPPVMSEPAFQGTIRPNYMSNIFPRFYAQYPLQNHLQYGSNPYWPYRHPPHRLPPPPPPPPEKCDMQNIVQNSNMEHGKNIKDVVKNVNIISHCLPKNLIILTGNNGARDQVNNNKRSINVNDNIHYQLSEQNVQINKGTSEIDSKPVNSKTEMFRELQKEMMTINSEISLDHTVSNEPKQSRINDNILDETTRNFQKNCQSGGNDAATVFNNHTLHPTSFASDSKGLYNNWKEDKRKIIKKDDSLDWKIQRSDDNKNTLNDNNMQNDGIRSSDNKTPIYPASTPNRSKAGPLCMKNRTGPFARIQTPPRSQHYRLTEFSQPNKGYSPPILPIPTFEKSLEMLTHVNETHRHRNKDKTFSNVPKTTLPQQERNKTQMKRQQYFCMENEGKSLKKISLQDYQNRVAKGDSKCIVVNRDKSYDRVNSNQSFEQDLGYDSDSTVKL